eukprot:m.79793 g.79793  ORF g.79793 m.79793 type:complete len:69 (+) comp13295_c0_seq6:130-336(+)
MKPHLSFFVSSHVLKLLLLTFVVEHYALLSVNERYATFGTVATSKTNEQGGRFELFVMFLSFAKHWRL